MIARQLLEKTLVESLWSEYLLPTSDASRVSYGEVRLDVLSEALKVLCSPYMSNPDKVMLLQSISQLFNAKPLIRGSFLLDNVVEPFRVLFGVHYTDGFIVNMATEKRDIVKERFWQCTFKPETNTTSNDKIAAKKYKVD